MTKELLTVKNLSVDFVGENSVVHAVKNLNYTLNEGQTLGIVGESGSGKSVSSLALMQLLPMPPAKITSGEVHYKGKDLLNMGKKELQKIRGNEISMIFQEPMTALNPLMTIGEQIQESILIHQNVTKQEAFDQSVEMLRKVEILHPEKRVHHYPHQLSGGMRQRVMIAIALCCDPSLLICDEPTTALDVTTQAQILSLINRLKDDFNTAVIMITHDLGVVSTVADHVLVMYKGETMEVGAMSDIFNSPQHDYTKALLAAIPDIDNRKDRLEVVEHALQVGDVKAMAESEIFDKDAYELKNQNCASELVEVAPGHWVRRFVD